MSNSRSSFLVLRLSRWQTSEGNEMESNQYMTWQELRREMTGLWSVNNVSIDFPWEQVIWVETSNNNNDNMGGTREDPGGSSPLPAAAYDIDFWGKLLIFHAEAAQLCRTHPSIYDLQSCSLANNPSLHHSQLIMQRRWEKGERERVVRSLSKQSQLSQSQQRGNFIR